MAEGLCATCHKHGRCEFSWNGRVKTCVLYESHPIKPNTGIDPLKEFAKDLIRSQVEMPPEFIKVVDDHLWELIEDASQEPHPTKPNTGELLPCPFCGTDDLKFKGEYHANYRSHVIECFCSAKVYGLSFLDVVKLWNNRAS
jgi:hypothetical protein